MYICRLTDECTELSSSVQDTFFGAGTEEYWPPPWAALARGQAPSWRAIFFTIDGKTCVPPFNCYIRNMS
jgi:hypothetical protein